MKVLLSKNSGYCYGVKRAMKIAEDSLNNINNVASLGYIIHNENAIKKLKQQGLLIYDDVNEFLKDSKKKKIKNIIFRSHGIEKKYYKVAKNNDINIIDTTCVFVKKIHEIVDNYYKKGYKILIAGDEKHAEVVGINSYCNYSANFIKSSEDLWKFNVKSDEKYILVFQTTFNTLKVKEIENVFLKKVQNGKIFNTICNATKKRQDSAEKTALKADLMIVVGDKKSSNTRKLYEIVKKIKPSLFIEDLEEFKLIISSGNNLIKNKNMIIGITAGASTPNFVVDEIISYLEKI